MTRLSLVHDYLYVYGGAERLLEHVHAVWPDAPLYTLLYVKDRLPETFRKMDVRTTWADRLPARLRLQRLYAMLQPIAFAGVRPSGDVLSFASFGAKAVRPAAGHRHVCYCFTPPRFLWGPYPGIVREELPLAIRLATGILERALRHWDLGAAQRVDCFITMSRYVADHIRRVYGRESEVVAPPVDVERFHHVEPHDGGYFLAVGRFEAYKRFDLAIQACTRLRLPLKIIGGGVDERRLRRLAGDSPYVEFLGSVSDQAVATYLAGCRALLFPGEEDFGLTAVEAQAAGKPVVAYVEGGAQETVILNETGVFFDHLSAESLEASLQAFDPRAFDPARCRASADRFAPERFRVRLRETVDRLLSEGRTA